MTANDTGIQPYRAPAVRLMENVHLQRFLGDFSEEELRKLRSLTVNVPAEMLIAVDRLVGDPRTGYGNKSEFVRHALHALLMAWVDGGWPDQYVYDVVHHARVMRESSHRIRLRQDFDQTITAYEVLLNDGAELGDWDLIIRTLETLKGHIDSSPDPYWGEYLRRQIAHNPAAKRAISVMFDATTESGGKGKRAKDLRRKAIAWQHWLEALHAADEE